MQGRSSRGIEPLTFHLCNVLAHAAATALVYALARRLASARQLPRGAAPAAAAGLPIPVLEPLLAALLFASHPVHTEAVAGVVGHAELLGACLAIPALLAYMAAASEAEGGRCSGAASTAAAPFGWCRHWLLVAAAVVLGWAAALAKEIGITIVSSTSRGMHGAAGILERVAPWYEHTLAAHSFPCPGADGRHAVLRCPGGARAAAVGGCGLAATACGLATALCPSWTATAGNTAV